VNTGDHVRDFTAVDEEGEPVVLYDLLEQGPVVLFFYPKAKTPL
jgi:peroxiredoxin Q/BCP